MFDFRRITLFRLEKRFSMHKITIFSKNFGGGMAPLATPGYAYVKRYHNRSNGELNNMRPSIKFYAVVNM